MVKKNQERCGYCQGDFNWSDVSTELVPSAPVVNEKYESGIPVDSGEISTFSEVNTVPTFSGVEKVAGETPRTCPCGQKTVETECEKKMRERRESLLKRSGAQNTPVQQVVFVGITRPYDVRKKPGFEKDHPGASSFVSRLYWIRADGKDKEVKISWLWFRKEEQFAEYADLLFKVIDADVVEYELKGKKMYKVGRFYKRIASVGDEVEATEKMLSAHGTDPAKILEWQKTRDPLDSFRTATGTVFTSRETDFGYSLRVGLDSQEIAAEPLLVLVSKELSKKIRVGMSVLITGEIYKRKAHERTKTGWKETGEEFPAMSATGIAEL